MEVELVNHLLANDNFSANYARREVLEQRLTQVLHGMLAAGTTGLWGAAHFSHPIHDFEMKSPLLALTGACIVSSVCEVLPRNWKLNIIMPAAVVTCWLITWLWAADQQDPWDLLKIGSPITAGLTMRSVIKPMIDCLAKYKAGVEHPTLLQIKGGHYAV